MEEARLQDLQGRERSGRLLEHLQLYRRDQSRMSSQDPVYPVVHLEVFQEVALSRGHTREVTG